MMKYRVADATPTFAVESAEASIGGTARFLKNGTAMTPYYTIKDHLGSVRTIVNASGTVVERNDYYPFVTRTTFGTSYATLATNRQKFSGKEDQTTVVGSTLPYLDFGARMYDLRLVRWSTYDPMAEKYYGINPYVYCNGDPVNLIDLKGDDIYVFDRNGNYEEKKNSKGKHQIEWNTVDDYGNDVKRFFSFADPINDPIAIDNGEITKLILVSEKTVLEMLSNQGTFDPSISFLDFINSSNSLNINDFSFDYTSSELANRYNSYMFDNEIRSNYLFITQGDKMAHNLMNYGNYLWGASGYTFGIPLSVLKAGAPLNSIGLFGKKTNRTYNGYNPQLDSVDDQRSIKEGYRYAMRKKYRNYRKK